MLLILIEARRFVALGLLLALLERLADDATVLLAQRIEWQHLPDKATGLSAHGFRSSKRRITCFFGVAQTFFKISQNWVLRSWGQVSIIFELRFSGREMRCRFPGFSREKFNGSMEKTSEDLEKSS